MNKLSGDLSGKMLLTLEQVVDVYSGQNLSKDKKDSFVNGVKIIDSGVANYILMEDTVQTAQDVIDKMIPIRTYVEQNPDIYFACKALNYRTFEKKWDGDRPLSVQVDWYDDNSKLTPKLIYNQPLVVKGNEMANRLLKYMDKLNIKTTDDIEEKNLGTDKIV